MFYAKLFDSEEIVSARDVHDGKIDRKCEFVDIEDEFRVIYIKAAKANGRPHFRLYLSREDYNNLSEEKKTRYDILSKMRHYSETGWHMKWKERFLGFAEIEKYIKNEKTGKYKYADVLYEKAKTCIEIQHSFIGNDFETRNSFYKELGYRTIWLYDLTSLTAKPIENGMYQILENNSKGLFRIAEFPQNLYNNNVFIQVKDERIYWIYRMYRNETESNLKSTIRSFYPLGTYTADQFVNMIRNKKFSFMKDDELRSVFDLWNEYRTNMIVENTITGKQMRIYRDFNDRNNMWMNGSNIAIKYVSFDEKLKKYTLNSEKTYSLYISEAKKRVWKLLAVFYD